jgi:hypothetical protein
VALPLLGCATDEAANRNYTGVWQWSFETSAFTTTTGQGPYWLVAEGQTWEQLIAPLRAAGGPWGRVAIVVEGDLSPVGQYGHLGAYSRQLRVTRVIESRLLGTMPAPQGS